MPHTVKSAYVSKLVMTWNSSASSDAQTGSYLESKSEHIQMSETIACVSQQKNNNNNNNRACRREN